MPITSHGKSSDQSPAQLDLGPIGRTARRAKDAIRYAHGAAAISQANETLLNYGKRLLSKQVARDVERLTAFLCDMVRRGVPAHLAKRCLDLIAHCVDEVAGSKPDSWDRLTMPELHQRETELQWKREAAETPFMHQPT